MKKFLLLSLLLSTAPVAALAADLAIEPTATPVVAAGGAYSGYVAVSGNAANWDYWDDDYNPWVGFGISAAIAYQLDDSWQVELEVRSGSVTESYDNEYGPFQTLVALHVNYTLGDASIGAFGGVLGTSGYYGYGDEYGVLGGIEGAIAVTDNIVLDGQIGATALVSGYYDGDDAYQLGFVQVGAKYFLLDNLKLSAYVGYIAGELYGEDYGASVLTYGAEVEYKFDDSPLSLFASYSGYTDSDYFESSADAVKVGAKFSFDGQSLKDQAKTGASHSVADLDAISWLRYSW